MSTLIQSYFIVGIKQVSLKEHNQSSKMLLIFLRDCYIILQVGKTGCGEAWYRAWFGTKRPRVRISTLRPVTQSADCTKKALKALIHNGFRVFSLSLPQALHQAKTGNKRTMKKIPVI